MVLLVIIIIVAVRRNSSTSAELPHDHNTYQFSNGSFANSKNKSAAYSKRNKRLLTFSPPPTLPRSAVRYDTLVTITILGILYHSYTAFPKALLRVKAQIRQLQTGFIREVSALKMA